MQGTRGDLLLAPAVPGDIMLVHMNGQAGWRIQKASYMASDASITIGTKMQGLAAGCCSGEGFFILHASGQGRLLLNSYGGIIRYDLKPGEVHTWLALTSHPSSLRTFPCYQMSTSPNNLHMLGDIAVPLSLVRQQGPCSQCNFLRITAST